MIIERGVRLEESLTELSKTSLRFDEFPRYFLATAWGGGNHSIPKARFAFHTSVTPAPANSRLAWRAARVPTVGERNGECNLDESSLVRSLAG